VTTFTVTPDLLDDLARTAAQDGIEKIVVGAVIASEDGKVLLLHRPADDYLGGLWELPSGGVNAVRACSMPWGARSPRRPA
jgi:8-oxo-dGTP diphosphatase